MSYNRKKPVQSELLSLQSNVGEDVNKEHYSKNEELVHREKVENTPFHIVGTEDKGYFLVMGKYKLCENKDSIEEVKEHLETNKWDIIVRMVTTTHEMVVNSMLQDVDKNKEEKES